MENNVAVAREAPKTMPAAQVLNGMMAYAEAELLPMLKGWLEWAGFGALLLVRQKVNEILPSILADPTVVTLGLVDEKGGVNVDLLMDTLKAIAGKYGGLSIDVKLVGSFTLSVEDLDVMRGYIDSMGAQGA